MTRKEKMREARDNYINYLLSMGHNYVSIDNMEALFEAGVKWCDANSPTPWVSVKEDLPCFHKELINIQDKSTKKVIVMDKYDGVMVDFMKKAKSGVWYWSRSIKVLYWFPIPELPKE